jgi:hypothetical protein
MKTRHLLLAISIAAMGGREFLGDQIYRLRKTGAESGRLQSAPLRTARLTSACMA